MTALELLRRARNRIADPKRWTQGWFARDLAGGHVECWVSEAVCWCAYGALGAEAALLDDREHTKQLETQVLDLLTRFAGQESITEFNDKNSHQDVIRVFDEAIHSLETLP